MLVPVEIDIETMSYVTTGQSTTHHAKHVLFMVWSAFQSADAYVDS